MNGKGRKARKHGIRRFLSHFIMSVAVICLFPLFFTSLSHAEESLFDITIPEATARVAVHPEAVKPGDNFRLEITVVIPERHHGYLDAGEEGFLIPVTFDFSRLEEAGLSFDLAEKPEGSLDAELKANSFHGEGRFVFQGSVSDTAKDGPLPDFKIRFQLCNDETKQCFAPAETNLAIPLKVTGEPGSSGMALSGGTVPSGDISPADSGEETLSFSERLSRSLGRYFENPFFALLISFLGGLLAAATPCVYPMIPITVQIIAARGGESGKASRHAFSYFFGIVFMYSALGFIAGMTGGGFNQVMQIPWVILSIAVLFAVLALSLFDVFVLQIPASMSFQSKAEKTSGLTGTFLMGLGAGLVVSPCVGPIVIAILVKVTEKIGMLQQQAAMAQSTVDFLARLKFAGYGGLLMAGFGLGIGLPFLLAGLVTQKMPKPGSWMVYVKSAMGLLILYFAYIYYNKAMATWGVPEDMSRAMLWGIIFILLGVFLGAFRPLGEKNPSLSLYKKGGGIVLLVIGVCFLYNGLRYSGIILPAATGLTAPAPSGPVEAAGAVEVHGNLTWHRNYQEALERASKENRPVFLDFYANWCANCKSFGELAVKNDTLNRALLQSVPAKIYDTDPIFKTFKNDPRFPELKIGLPFFVILLPDETLVWKGTDYRAVNTFAAQLARAQETLTGKASP